MNLTPYVESIQRQLAATAEASGQEARALAERLATPLDAAIRITLQDALVAAAEEITCELAPGSVEVRLRGRETELVVTAPPVAVARCIVPDAVLRYAGGREVVLRDLQAYGMLAGANGLIVGNYLTTLGRSAEADLAMLADLGMPVAERPLTGTAGLRSAR